jgi:hypothetical protein
MTIVEKNGRYHARHVTKGEVPETAGESELHKALKNHTAETASRDGFGVTVEDRAVHGRRRTDVTIGGPTERRSATRSRSHRSRAGPWTQGRALRWTTASHRCGS